MKNNGDGTVTCVFEHFCPVAFCVEVTEDSGDNGESGGGLNPPQTGDEMGGQMLIWISAMVLSMVGMVALLVYYRRSSQKS